ncbi:hypothetical protein [Streptosporangium subroseum]|nr:hypothetical protein [Streptosporangium subroseum]
MPAAILALAVLSGCGGNSAPGAPAAEKASATADSQAKRHQIESVRADCMKQKGFTYIAFVPAPHKIGEEERKRDSGDYTAMKKWREKNGYGVFAFYVYPQEYANPMVEPEGGIPEDPNPNNKIQMSFSDTQREAYNGADRTCYQRAVKDATGKKIDSVDDYYEQANARSEQLATRELDGDPRLVELTVSMGNCLKNKGYPIGSTKPSALADRGRLKFEAEKKPLGERIPESMLKKMDMPEGARWEPNLTADQARPYLAREIKDALDDLKCGKDFYPAFTPGQIEVQQRAYQEFGL